MNLADVFTVTFVIIGFIIVFVAYWLLAAGLFPAHVERCAEKIGRPIRALLTGAVTLVPAVVAGLGISSAAPNPVLKVIGLGIALMAMLAALFGSAGLALRIGRGLKSERDEREPWRVVLRGGTVLGLTFAMPFLGTFVVMGFSLIAGAGAFVLALFSPGRAPVIAPEPAVPPLPSTAS